MTSREAAQITAAIKNLRATVAYGAGFNEAEAAAADKTLTLVSTRLADIVREHDKSKKFDSIAFYRACGL